MYIQESEGMSILKLRQREMKINLGSPEWRDKREKFIRFHNRNPHVYQLFNKYASEAYVAGNKKFSHWLIMNRIRWDSLVKTDGDKYKIPNEHIAFYARLWVKRNPKTTERLGHDFFTLKKMKGEPHE